MRASRPLKSSAQRTLRIATSCGCCCAAGTAPDGAVRPVQHLGGHRAHQRARDGAKPMRPGDDKLRFFLLRDLRNQMPRIAFDDDAFDANAGKLGDDGGVQLGFGVLDAFAQQVAMADFVDSQKTSEAGQRAESRLRNESGALEPRPDEQEARTVPRGRSEEESFVKSGMGPSAAP